MDIETLRTTYIPVRDYAAKHKLTVQAVYKRVRTGRLKMRRIGTYMLVRTSDPQTKTESHSHQ